MGFEKKEWKDRITEYPTRRNLVKEGGTTETVTVERNEGSVSQEGDAFSAENMNDLEQRIEDAIGTQDISAIGDGTVTGGISALNTGVERINTALAGISLRVLTQAQYNALGSKDANTLYVIVG